MTRLASLWPKTSCSCSRHQYQGVQDLFGNVGVNMSEVLSWEKSRMGVPPKRLCVRIVLLFIGNILTWTIFLNRHRSLQHAFLASPPLSRVFLHS